MEYTLEDITTMIEKAQAAGVDTLEAPGVKIVFKKSQEKLNESISRLVPDMKADEIFKPMSSLDDLSPEEILYYATPHYDEIQAQKEQHKQQLKEEGLA